MLILNAHIITISTYPLLLLYDEMNLGKKHHWQSELVLAFVDRLKHGACINLANATIDVNA